MHNSKILIVEDDLISAAYLKKICRNNGLNACYATDNSHEALRIVEEKKPDLILMDVMIKGPLSGSEIAIKIRSFDETVIIIFITAHFTDEMIEYALMAKAYSYLLKPYRDIEIISTIKMALIEIKFKDLKNNIVTCKNGFSFNTVTNQLYQYNKEIFLTNKLFILIKILIKHRGLAISYEQISYELWGDKKSINTIRASIHRLKTKLPELELHTANKHEYVLY